MKKYEIKATGLFTGMKLLSDSLISVKQIKSTRK